VAGGCGHKAVDARRTSAVHAAVHVAVHAIVHAVVHAVVYAVVHGTDSHHALGPVATRNGCIQSLLIDKPIYVCSICTCKQALE
jgi:hypothetical protein